MSLSFATGTVLPILVITIMFGLGLGLTRADFARVFYSPKPVLIGLLCQSLILPAVAFLLCYVANLDGALSIGLVLLAASPGGPSANFFSHLAKGDVALNLTLTAVNSVTGMFILPALVYLACVLFLDDGVA
ncbi:MAG TPA: bile acid:sodium symporter, partial [Bdellovibrionales bacterium]|nr:bile acid:sodium symporter [Bdellovibrionales bacterium]